MTKLQRLKEKLDQAIEERAKYIRAGKIVIPSNLATRIKNLQEQIQFVEDTTPRSLEELVDRKTLLEHKIPERIIKLHFAADFLDECAFDLKEAFKELEIESCALIPKVKEIHKLSSDFASMVCHDRFQDLKDAMINDEKLIDQLNAVLDDYIEKEVTSKKTWKEPLSA